MSAASVGVGISTGNDGCPCANQTSVLASLFKRSCTTAEGQDGVLLTVNGPCAPYSFGSDVCLPHAHDLPLDSNCIYSKQHDELKHSECARRWCYVDASCDRSSERLIRSTFFDREDDGVDLFYSFTTCDSSEEDLFQPKASQPFGGRSIVAAVPGYIAPFHYKSNDEGEILAWKGSEYYNNSIEFEGILINYFNELEKISKGDFDITFKYGSQGGKRFQNGSFNGVIQDVKDGLVDIGAGIFWRTTERLKLSSFSDPLGFSRTVLVVKKPEETASAMAGKVFSPLGKDVWFLIVGLIVFTAFLSVWFSREKYGRGINQRKRQDRIKKSVYARLLLDEFLEKGIFFWSAGVGLDEAESLPQKLLMFGFAFFILIIVSCYVANLAAFLTRPNEFQGTMEVMITQNKSICVNENLKEDTEARWGGSGANFVYVNDQDEQFNALDNGNCDVMTVSDFGVRTSTDPIVNEYCERNLLVTEEVVLEYPIAFPVNEEVASGLSYWMAKAEKKGVTLGNLALQYSVFPQNRPICDSTVAAYEGEASEYTQLHLENVALPIIFFLVCAVMAIVLQLYHERSRSTQSRPLLGRNSVFHSRKYGIFLGSRKKLKEEDVDAELATTGDGLPERAVSPIVDQDRRRTWIEQSSSDGESVEKRSEQRSTKKVSFCCDMCEDCGAQQTPRHTSCKGPALRPQQNDCAKNIDVPEDIDGSFQQFQKILSNDEDVADGDKASSRIKHLVETGALDELLDCLQDIKRGKQD